MMSWPSHRRYLFWSKVCWFLIHVRVAVILQNGNDVAAFSSFVLIYGSNGNGSTTSCSSSASSSRLTATTTTKFSSLCSLPPNKNYNERAIRGTDNDDEPLSFRFQRAVVLQRAGEYTDALQEYQMFVKAAESCNVSPELYAEVHVNMGAIFMKWKNWSEARTNFEKALNYREDNMASAHVNLALLILAEGRQQAAMSSSSLSQASSQKEMNDISRQCLKQAWGHCEQALSSVKQDDDMVHSATRMTATRIMTDIEAMLKQIGEEIPPSHKTNNT